MSGLTHPALTNYHLTRLSPERRKSWWARAWAMIRRWHAVNEQHVALARLSQRELADFGASSADVYRELRTPFWRGQPPC